jgi:hypothetical protein
MKIRKSIKVFAVVAVGLMLMLGAFMRWEWKGKDYPSFFMSHTSYGMSPGDLRQWANSLLDFKERKLARCYSAMDSYRPRLDEVARADSGDVEVLMGIVELYWSSYGLLNGETFLATIRTNWPEYRPAMEVQAWAELYSLGEYISVLRRFDNLSKDADMKIAGRYLDDCMLTRDDPFLQAVNDPNIDDPNQQMHLVTDVAAARKAIGQRAGTKADAGIARLRQLDMQDPNNAIYDYMLAGVSLSLDRRDEGIGYVKAMSGKKMGLYRTEKLACLKKAMDKAGFPAYLQTFAADRHQSQMLSADSGYARFLRERAADMGSRGDADGAKVLRDAAAKLEADNMAVQTAGKK